MIITFVNENKWALVELNEHEMDIAGEVGRRRTHWARGHNVVEQVSAVGGMDSDMMGARSEFAASQYLGIAWNISIGTVTDPDLRYGIEVRCRKERGRLCIRKRDKWDSPYVHVVATGNRFLIKGWTTGQDGWERGEKLLKGKTIVAYVNDWDLRSLESLDKEVLRRRYRELYGEVESEEDPKAEEAA